MKNIVTLGRTDVGLKRTNNEDSFMTNAESGFCLVADGMGGAAAGELASMAIAETAMEIFSSSEIRSEEDAVERVRDAFLKANQKILSHVDENPHHKGMGCTAELISFFNNGFVIGHVGDSRTYRLRTRKLKQLTRDHSLVQDQLDQGVITVEEARKHPYRNVINRAVGINQQLALDLLRGKTYSGDLFLLCSDGLTDMVEDSTIEEVLSSNSDLAQKAGQLIEAAKAGGGKDNITVVLSEVV